MEDLRDELEEKFNDSSFGRWANKTFSDRYEPTEYDTGFSIKDKQEWQRKLKERKSKEALKDALGGIGSSLDSFLDKVVPGRAEENAEYRKAPIENSWVDNLTEEDNSPRVKGDPNWRFGDGQGKIWDTDKQIRRDINAKKNNLIHNVDSSALSGENQKKEQLRKRLWDRIQGELEKKLAEDAAKAKLKNIELKKAYDAVDYYKPLQSSGGSAATSSQSSGFNPKDYQSISFVGPNGGWKQILSEDDFLVAVILSKLYPGLVHGLGEVSGVVPGTSSVGKVPESAKLPEEFAKKWQEIEKAAKKIYQPAINSVIDKVGKEMYANSKPSQGTWVSEELQQAPADKKTDWTDWISENAKK